VKAVIVANGVIADAPRARARAGAADLLICADGGARHVLAWGLWPAIVVGDMDSLDEATLARLAAGGARLARHPAHKDETDLELALDLALAEGATEIRILGALGGRLDQTLANILLLTVPRFQAVPIIIDDGREQLFLGRSPIVLRGAPGDLVSLIPLSPAVSGITTAGLEYPLRADNLYLGLTRGISNVMLGTEATVTFEAGLLLVSRRDMQSDDPM
jgi:thiamine pyrophosphokinase